MARFQDFRTFKILDIRNNSITYTEIHGIICRVLCKLVKMLEVAYVTLQIQKYTRNTRNFITTFRDFRFLKGDFNRNSKGAVQDFKGVADPLTLYMIQIGIFYVHTVKTVKIIILCDRICKKLPFPHILHTSK